MRKLNILHRAAVAFFAFLLLFTQLGIFAAATSYDPSIACTLRVKFRSDDSNAQGVRFRIYRVADISSDGYYSTSGDFTDYGIHFGGLDSAGWTREARLLLEHIRQNNIKPLAENSVNETGMAVFQDLQNGLYLVEGDSYEHSYHTYTPAPFFVGLPNPNEKNAWEYTVTSDAKYKDDYNPPGGGPGGSYATLKVVKTWKGDTASDRPAKITVELFYKGTHNRTVTLNRANNWTYTDNRIDSSGLNQNWSVEEVKVDGYVTEDVSVNVSGSTVTISIINKKDTPDNPNNPDNPKDPDDPDDPDNPNDPDDPDDLNRPDEPYDPHHPNHPNQPETKEQSKLPQTGMLWWPVPIFYLLGIILTVVGLFIRREKNEQNGKA